MTVDGLVNVQCGEAFHKYDIDPFINICLDKEKYFGQLTTIYNFILPKKHLNQNGN